MKKVQKLLIAALCVTMGASMFVACGDDAGNTPGGGKYTVTFYDGTTVLSTQEVEHGGKAVKPTPDPTKEGFDFLRWYATPSYNIVYNFDTEIEEATSVFAGFRSTAADTHTWYLAGTSKSGLFNEAGDWKGDLTDATVPDSVKLAQSTTKGNEFTITCDLFKGDQFQILNTADGWNGTSFSGQIGYGYMNPDQYSTENTAQMYGQSNPYDAGAKKQNITVGVSGNYTIKLTVDTNGNKLTEISYVRNGDIENADIQYEYYILGEKLNNWNTKALDFTHFATEDHSRYTLTIGMFAGDMFQFNSIDSNETALRWGPANSVLADDAKTTAAITNIADKNFGIAGGAGTYTFTLTLTKDGAGDDVLTVAAEKVAETMPDYDFYVKGSIGGDTSWSQKHQMTAGENGDYTLTVAIAQGEEFMLVATEKGDLNTTVFNITTAYAVDRFVSDQIEYKGNNFRAKSADTFTIKINAYTMAVSVSGESDEATVYAAILKGTVNGWDATKATAEQKVVFTSGNTADMTVTLNVDDEFMFITCDNADATCAQVHYINAGAITLCDGLTGTQNIKCTKAGTYKFTITIDDIGNFVSVTVVEVA